MTAVSKAHRAACRIVNRNSCGSGWYCGDYEGGEFGQAGVLIMTNAHVAGTQRGRIVRVDIVVNGTDMRYSAKVIVAAYSNQSLTDWALLLIENVELPFEPVKLTKQVPDGSSGNTKGSPRCVWPQVNTDIAIVEIQDNSPLVRWRPNAIGGQSGSGVYYDDPRVIAFALLTWTWGGLGAGQQTAWIYRQAMTRSTDAPPRPEGLQVPIVEETENVEWFTAALQAEGVEMSEPDRTDCDDPVVEEGFFVHVEALPDTAGALAAQEVSIIELPIWHEDDPVDPPSPPPGNEKNLAAVAAKYAAEQAEIRAEQASLLAQEAELHAEYAKRFEKLASNGGNANNGGGGGEGNGGGNTGPIFD